MRSKLIKEKRLMHLFSVFLIGNLNVDCVAFEAYTYTHLHTHTHRACFLSLLLCNRINTNNDIIQVYFIYIYIHNKNCGSINLNDLIDHIYINILISFIFIIWVSIYLVVFHLKCMVLKLKELAGQLIIKNNRKIRSTRITS